VIFINIILAGTGFIFMNFYSQIYYKLCNENVNNKIHYCRGSNIHKHHIIPRHAGGGEDESNFTYLSVRQHIIAHFLLWKMHRMVNDLRSMHMLGAKLTYEQRSIVGKWCHENKIGMFSFSKEEKAEISRKNGKRAKERKTGIHNPETFSKFASLGGKASIVSLNNPWSYWASKEGRSKRAQMGGRIHTGKVWIHKGDTTTRCLFNEIEEKMNEGWQYGMKDGGKEYVNNGDRTFRIETDRIFKLILRGWQLGKAPNYKPNRKRSKHELSYAALLELECQDEHIQPK
jgi:hypothetical protein